jgi:hypothetical protein
MRAAACFSALLRSRRPATLVGLPLSEVGREADVVDVQGRPVGVEVEDPVDGRLEAVAASWLMTTSPPTYARSVSRSQVIESASRVVRRLVEEQRLGADEEDPGQLDPAPLAARQRGQGLVQDPVGEPERGRDAGCLGLGGQPAPRRRAPPLQPAVPPQRALGGLAVGAGHRPFGVAQRAAHLVSPRADSTRSRASWSSRPVRGS